MRRLLLLFFFSGFLLSASAQMWNGADTLFGNEWIQYDQQYFKVMVAEDGVYRIPYETLQSSGIPVNAIDGSRYQLWRLGEEQPLYVTQNGPLGPGDFIEFYGRRNRSELDRYLFRDPDNQMVNPWYSLITDTSAYFLTWVEPGEPTLRYEQVDNSLVNLPAKEEWIWEEREQYFIGQVAKTYEVLSGVDIYYSHFDGEGFASSPQTSRTFFVNCPDVYTGGPPAELDLRFISNANTAGHALEVRIDDELLVEEQFSGALFKKFLFDRAASSLGDSLKVRVSGLNNNDKYAVGGAILHYPRIPVLNAGGFNRFILPEGSGPRYLEMEGAGISGPAVLLDLSNRRRLALQQEGNLWKAKLPAATGEQQLAISSVFHTIESLDPVDFIDYENTDADFLIISNARLFDDGQGNNWVEEYANYRRSEAGGNYAVAVVEVQQLYDQFAYGVNRHPLSIRNFAHYAVRNWPSPRYCFIIGKGQEYPGMRRGGLVAAVADGRMMVPSFGTPASDNLLLSDNYTSIPVIPVGRLAATDGKKVKIYLDKVQAVEANRANPQSVEGRAWMKRVIHLGGGSSANEQTSIRFVLEAMGGEIENNAFGGVVRSFYKTSTDPIQTSLSEQIFGAINEGSSIVTFMGHSSPGTFDFNIDNPDNYNNYGKYPLMLSLGCYSGNIFTSGESIGERFIFYENRAAVAFGASRGVGVISSLGAFARGFYDYMGGDYYGQGIGDGIRAALADYDQNPYIGTATLVEQFTLQGDPSIRLNPAPGPDFVVDPASVEFEPRLVTAQQDSFSLSFDVVNLGQYLKDTFTVEIRQELPGGNTVDVIRDTVAGPAFRSNYTYRIPGRGKEAVGLNTFFIRLDADSEVAELPFPAAELNNELVRSNGQPGAPLFIVDNTARPVYPPDFALISEAPPTLKASTTDALAPERTYLLEIDTTALFDSPLKQRTAITQRGGVIRWAPSLPWRDSTVYYWRISPDSTAANAGGYTWEQSSFTYIEGSPPGWGQGHYWQWLEGVGDGLVIEDNHKFSFGVDGFVITVRCKTVESQDPPTYVYNLENPASSVRPWTFMDEGIAVVVGDSLTGAGWINPPGGAYGSVNANSNTRVFGFPTEDAASRQALITFLEDVIPPKSYVFLFTVLNTPQSSLHLENWEMDSMQFGKDIFSVLENQGAYQVRELKNLGSVPYGMVFQKDVQVLDEGIANSINDILTLEAYIPVKGTKGYYETPLAGPALKWERLSWEVAGQEPGDIVQLDLIGINPLGEETVIVEGDTTRGLSLEELSPGQYPYLKARFFFQDAGNRTSPQLDYCRFFYEGKPELGLSPNDGLDFHADTLLQGDQLRLSYYLESLNPNETDSLLIEYKITGPDNEELASAVKVPPLEGNANTRLSFEQDTRQMIRGRHTLSVVVNPEEAQPEQTLFNNYLNLPFYIELDQLNPVLNVTFDGQVISDGALVSPQPEIIMLLADENDFLLLDDTSILEVMLTYPDGRSVRVAFDSEKLEFFPAQSGEKNEAKVRYTPTFTEDGIYRLSVQGRDPTGNKSGKFSYEASFEVITKNSISHVLNYPNPFSTSTQFVFTVTGEVPYDFRIQVMTVSGRVVKQITKEELGPIHYGLNRTEYAWDGTDDYGGRLANGVYLYRVIARDIYGKDYEIYQNSSDSYFKKGFGKLVILR